MQAVILSAGLGSRMGVAGEQSHGIKTMTSINGKPLLEKTLENLSAYGITKVVIVVGYKAGYIQDYFGESFKDIHITYCLNNDYQSKNNIYSLWLCRQYLCEEDSFIIEGDVVFEPSILANMDHAGSNVIGAMHYQPWMNGTVIELGEDDAMCFTKANLSRPDATKLKTINIYKFSREFSQFVYLPQIQEKIEKQEFHLYYEDVITTEMMRVHFDIYTINGEKCFEMDNPHDLQIAKLMFASDNERYDLLINSYGGLWKSPGIYDYYFLTNPYFPTNGFFQEIGAIAKEVIMNYPSGRKMIDTMAAAMFKVSPDYTAVSNGASEIIDLLIRTLPGKFGTFIPTFEEYINRAGVQQMLTCPTLENDFHISIADIISLSAAVDNIILVNPNNPTGQIIEKEVLEEALMLLQGTNKRLIIDESFADFCDHDISLLDHDILEQHPNLFIIKSLGKSYGIPGLRSGMLFSADRLIIDLVKAALPIWNINSFAEYFYDVFPRYRKDFLASCQKLVADRTYLAEKLQEMEVFKVFPSQGNFLLCEMLIDMNARDFAIALLRRHNILIKDCQQKIGLDNRRMIRLAVRSHEENQLLLNAIHAVCSHYGVLSENLSL
nr:aminotransferase class I/II-fold pyridoxal phosphate-dependent enzyme [uncultured Chitinophaga sp.]